MSRKIHRSAARFQDLSDTLEEVEIELEKMRRAGRPAPSRRSGAQALGPECAMPCSSCKLPAGRRAKERIVCGLPNLRLVVSVRKKYTKAEHGAGST